MNKIQKLGLAVLFSSVCLFGHGSVTPQKIDITGLKVLGDDWVSVNPYNKEDKRVLEVGKIGYGENCARCHGLDVISGGIAPDLRKLIPGDDDDYYTGRVLGGVVRNGNVYMPPFAEYLGQEAVWAIYSYINTQRDKALKDPTSGIE